MHVANASACAICEIGFPEESADVIRLSLERKEHVNE